jgi:hypothetical protein
LVVHDAVEFDILSVKSAEISWLQARRSGGRISALPPHALRWERVDVFSIQSLRRFRSFALSLPAASLVRMLL